MKKQLILVGAGHAHLSVLKHLGQFKPLTHDMTVINPSAYHYYSGMAPGMLSGRYRPRDIRFDIQKITTQHQITFLKDRVCRFNPETRQLFLNSGRSLVYDLVSFNTGSIVPAGPIRPDDDTVIPAKPVENLFHARQKITSLLKKGPLRITVAGGGAAGVEIAANIRQLIKNEGKTADITLMAGGGVLNRFHSGFGRCVRKALQRKGVRIIEGPEIKKYFRGRGELGDGSSFQTDLLIWAIGTRPESLFKASGIDTGKKDGLRVNACLQSTSYPDIFAGGDCACFVPRSLPKTGVYAVRQNPVLYHNLMARLTRTPCKRFVPQKAFMMILNMGDGSGILCRNQLVLEGKAAFALKDLIDRQFMKKLTA